MRALDQPGPAGSLGKPRGCREQGAIRPVQWGRGGVYCRVGNPPLRGHWGHLPGTCDSLVLVKALPGPQLGFQLSVRPRPPAIERPA